MTHTIGNTDIPTYLAKPATQAAVAAGWRRQAEHLRSHAGALGLSSAERQALLRDADRCDAKARAVAFMGIRLRNLKAAA